MKILYLILCLLVTLPSYAATYRATSCSDSDVITAIGLASNSDIVEIPEGNCTWNIRVDVTAGIHLKGDGTDKVIITPNLIQAQGQLAIFTSVSNPTTMVSGIKFSGGTSTKIIKFQGDGKTLIYDCEFEQYAGKAIWAGEENDSFNVTGVISNNYFHRTIATDVTIQIVGSRSDSWSLPNNLSALDNIVFVETNRFWFDNVSTGKGVVDSDEGARWVFRYNTVHNDGISTHGTCSGGAGARGLMQYEIYENIFSLSGIRTQVMTLRGGSGVIWNNVMDPGSVNDIKMQQFTVDNDGCTTGYPCCCTDGGYPCMDQIGRGQNQGTFPLYIWGNQHTGGGSILVAAVSSAGQFGGDCDTECGAAQDINDYIQLNRDYYLAQLPGYVPAKYPHYLIPVEPVSRGAVSGGVVSTVPGSQVLGVHGELVISE